MLAPNHHCELARGWSLGAALSRFGNHHSFAPRSSSAIRLAGLAFGHINKSTPIVLFGAPCGVG